MYQSISSVRRRPRSSVFLNQMLIHSFIRPSFIRLLTARSLRKSPFRETYKSVTKKRRKERRKRRFASKRRGGLEEEGETECVPYWHSLSPLSFKRIG